MASLKQHEPRDTAQPIREWLTDPERRHLRDEQHADIESGLHPERYVGWVYWPAECIEQGMRALCGSGTHADEAHKP